MSPPAARGGPRRSGSRCSTRTRTRRSPPCATVPAGSWSCCRPDPPGSAGAGDRLDHLAFAVPDRATLDGWVAHLDELGIEHPGVTDELGSHSLQLVDPDGTRVELVAHPTDPDPAALTSTQRVQPTDRRHDALDPTQRRATWRCRPVPSPGDPPRGRPDEAVRRRARSGPAAGVGHELARGEAAGAVDERHAERRELLHRPEAAHGHL